MVAFTEKPISTSVHDSFVFAPQHLTFDAKERGVKTGRSSKEGCFMKVFDMARCLMKMRPMTRPGRVGTRKARIDDKTGYSLMIG